MKFMKKKGYPTKAEIVEDITQLEKTLNMELPNELKEFLLKSAGTYPEPEYFRIQDFPYGDSDACYGFYGDKDSSFSHVLNDYRNRIPEGFLPIGYGAQGDVICYVLVGDKAGSIWYWDHENESPAAYIDQSNCYKCADNLQDFINGFFEDDDEDDDDDEDEDDE